jgi:hypothetical protein
MEGAMDRRLVDYLTADRLAPYSLYVEPFGRTGRGVAVWHRGRFVGVWRPLRHWYFWFPAGYRSIRAVATSKEDVLRRTVSVLGIASTHHD